MLPPAPHRANTLLIDKSKVVKPTSPLSIRLGHSHPFGWLGALLMLLFASDAISSLSAAQIVISPPGGKFAEAQRVVVGWDDPEEFRSLRYTLDGSDWIADIAAWRGRYGADPYEG